MLPTFCSQMSGSISAPVYKSIRPKTGSRIFQSWLTRSTLGDRQGQGATPGRQRWSPCTAGIARSGGRCCRPRTWSASWTPFLASRAPRLWHPLLLLCIKGQKTLPWYAWSPYSWEKCPPLPERLFWGFYNLGPRSQVWKVKGGQYMCKRSEKQRGEFLEISLNERFLCLDVGGLWPAERHAQLCLHWPCLTPASFSV